MLWTDTAEDTFLTNHGGVVLADWGTFPGLRKVIESQGYLCASLPVPGPAQRGRLAMSIEESIEFALERLGAVAAMGGAATIPSECLAANVASLRMAQRLCVVYGFDPADEEPSHRSLAGEARKRIEERVGALHLGVAIRGDDEKPRVRDVGREEFEELQRRTVRPVDVIEHDDLFEDVLHRHQLRQRLNLGDDGGGVGDARPAAVRPPSGQDNGAHKEDPQSGDQGGDQAD